MATFTWIARITTVNTLERVTTQNHLYSSILISVHGQSWVCFVYKSTGECTVTYSWKDVKGWADSSPSLVFSVHTHKTLTFCWTREHVYMYPTVLFSVVRHPNKYVSTRRMRISVKLHSTGLCYKVPWDQTGQSAVTVWRRTMQAGCKMPQLPRACEWTLTVFVKSYTEPQKKPRKITS